MNHSAKYSCVPTMKKKTLVRLMSSSWVFFPPFLLVYPISLTLFGNLVLYFCPRALINKPTNTQASNNQDRAEKYLIPEYFSCNYLYCVSWNHSI